MRRKYFLLITPALFFLVFLPAAEYYRDGSFAPHTLAATDVMAAETPASTLSAEELVSIVKPAVVRIVEHVTGDVSIIPFKINLKDFTVRSISGEKPLKMPLNTNLTGSGFVVNPDGYILTNAHVVSDTTIKMQIVQPIIQLVLAGELSSLSDADTKKMNQRTQEESLAFGKQILDYVVNASTFNINKTISVLDPSSKETSLDKLTENGLPVDVVQVNEHWNNDNRDVAVLKISEKNLPSLRLGTAQPLSVGAQVYVFGFPSNAELGSNNLLESTFTKGVVSAVKSSPNNDFKIFQTDAKISTGSSGGPLFNTTGQVAGLVTSETQSDAQSNGDNFAFAIPADIAKEALSENFIINDEGAYGSHMQAGLALLRSNHCKAALTEFTLAKSVNAKFNVANYVDPYIEKCNTLIASGLSIDSSWDEFKAKWRSMGMFAWALFAVAVFLFVMLGVAGMLLIKRLRKDKSELEHLEHALQEQSNVAGSTSPVRVAPLTTIVKRVVISPEERSTSTVATVAMRAQTPQALSQVSAVPATPGEPIPARPELLAYIKEARQSAMTFQMIEKALKDAGWNDDDIARALAVPQ